MFGGAPHHATWKQMSYGIVFSTAVFVVFAFYMMWLFDQLVRWEHDYHHEEWERDGRPYGFFWKSSSCTFWKSDMAKQRLMLVWLFKTPLWAAGKPKCRRWLYQFRAGNLLILAALVRLLSLLWKS
jgi:hypothetical protein